MHTVEIQLITIRTFPEPAYCSPDDGHNSVAVETSDHSQADSEENVVITYRDTVVPLNNVELLSFRHQLTDLRGEMDQMHDEINNIKNDNLPQEIDRAVEQSVLLASAQAINDMADQIRTRDSIKEQVVGRRG